MTPNERTRPIGAGPDDKTAAEPTDHDTSVPAATDFFRTSFAVLVRGSKSVRRHLYFNLPAAERTIQRAHARGDLAELILVRLVPVDARHLDGEVADDE